MAPLNTDADVVPAESQHVMTIHPNYFRVLRSAHGGWIFGAIAEFVDNARDAHATRLDIKIESFYSEKGVEIPILSIVDDGCGMSHEGIFGLMTLGYSKGKDPNKIGKFGTGFQKGSMGLGKDALVLTQTLTTRTVTLFSETFNENKENILVPIIPYNREGCCKNLDLRFQSEKGAEICWNAIKEVSPFNEDSVREKFGLFDEHQTGTQVYIWNLDRQGSDYSLQWDSPKKSENVVNENLDIIIRSRRTRVPLGPERLAVESAEDESSEDESQEEESEEDESSEDESQEEESEEDETQEVPFYYSLHAYLEVIFLNPSMRIYVQGSLVKSRMLSRCLSKTVVVQGRVLGKAIQLTLGRSNESANCGIFMYWRGRLIEAYKRVGDMLFNEDMGRGVIGVVDVTNIMDDALCRLGGVSLTKQSFCYSEAYDEAYDELEEWLGYQTDDYLNEKFGLLDLGNGNQIYKPDHEWVQCSKCHKWRIWNNGSDSEKNPQEWFCYLPPLNQKCETPEEDAGIVITVGDASSGGTGEESIRTEADALQPPPKRAK